MTDGGLDRRGFLGLALSGVPVARGAAASRPRHGVAKSGRCNAAGWVDVNVTLGQWPLRRVRGDTPAELAAMLRALGIVQAWAGTMDGLLHKDIGAANLRLTAECRRLGGLFMPFGSINPRLPDWEEEVRRCALEHRMPGIRLHPNYHGYKLGDPVFRRLLERAVELGLVVQLCMLMEDERMMHPLLRVEPVDVSPLAGVLRDVPGVRLVLLNALKSLKAKPLLETLAAGQVFVELAMLEGIAGLESLLQQVPVSRVLLGSHAPIFYPEAAVLKLQESAVTGATRASIVSGNALGLLHRAPG